MSRIRNYLRLLFYPGLDLHTRNRASLTRFWGKGPREVLDAGSGNGYFSWLAYKSGAKVVGINFDPGQVEKSTAFLNGFRGADPQRLHFERGNLYELDRDKRLFDEIICFEVLEHLKNDGLVASHYYQRLRPGGALHLCCPNRLHPRHQREVLDLEETGGHVRQGYTEQDYRSLLEPLGFTIERVVGIGPPIVYYSDAIVRKTRSILGDALTLPLFLMLLPLTWAARSNPKVPFSIYVTARKPTTK